MDKVLLNYYYAAKGILTDELAQTVTHEICGPASLIEGYTRYLLDEGCLEESKEDILDIHSDIAACSEKLSSNTGYLYLLSKNNWNGRVGKTPIDFGMDQSIKLCVKAVKHNTNFKLQVEKGLSLLGHSHQIYFICLALVYVIALSSKENKTGVKVDISVDKFNGGILISLAAAEECLVEKVFAYLTVGATNLTMSSSKLEMISGVVGKLILSEFRGDIENKNNVLNIKMLEQTQS